MATNINDLKEIKKLQRKVISIKRKISKADDVYSNTLNGIKWGQGMRCVKCTPSMSLLNELQSNLETVENKLNDLLVNNTFVIVDLNGDSIECKDLLGFKDTCEEYVSWGGFMQAYWEDMLSKIANIINNIQSLNPIAMER